MTNSILSDRIESFILDMLRKQASDVLLLKRKDVADLLECAPSQVTYVVNTRFSSNNRFVVESRRGNGGYIKISVKELPIKKIPSAVTDEKGYATERNEKKNDIAVIEDSLSGYFQMLIDYDIVSKREYQMIKVLMRTMLEFCPPENRRDAAKTMIHRVEWTLKGE